jgi:shikimate kinase
VASLATLTWNFFYLVQVIANNSCKVSTTGGGMVSEPATCELLIPSVHTVRLQTESEIHFSWVLKQSDARITTPALYKEAIDNIYRPHDARHKLYEIANVTIAVVYSLGNIKKPSCEFLTTTLFNNQQNPSNRSSTLSLMPLG